MAIPTPPHKIVCTHCHWRCYRPGHGDVLSPFERVGVLRCCPVCASEELVMLPLNPVEQVVVAPWIELARLLRRR